jgi:hypothetical protein
MRGVRREPVWSGALTVWLAARIPVGSRSAALTIIKVLHTAIFLSVASLIVLFAWDGLKGRPRRRTPIAAAIAFAETAVFISNNQVCPLTPLAEELGAASGSVTDIFLPDWLSRRIPLVSGSVLVVGVVLNLRAWRGRPRVVEVSRVDADRTRRHRAIPA